MTTYTQKGEVLEEFTPTVKRAVMPFDPNAGQPLEEVIVSAHKGIDWFKPPYVYILLLATAAGVYLLSKDGRR